MNRHRLQLRLLLALCTAAAFAFAGRVVQSQALAVANGFVQTDPVGARILPGRAARTAEARGSVWIVHLAPHGYVIVSGDDACEPIVFFSTEDFSEPNANSPFATVLDGASAGCTIAESSTPTLQSVAPRLSPRAARWDKLARATSLQSMGTPSASAVVVEPFLSASWNQCQPFNDFLPQCNPTNTGPYRGRTPCGCVAIAAAQMMRHWQWPARLDTVLANTHEFFPDGSTPEDFALRFDGHLPLDWDSIADTYPSSSFPTTDLRGLFPESLRLPIARLVFLCDVLSDMAFSPKSSAATFQTFADHALDWYRPVTFVNPQTNRTALATLLKAELLNHHPIQVNIPGHAVVGHGWADDGNTHYIYLNWDWGDTNNGWYNLDDATSDTRITSAAVGFIPRRKVQLDPLPAISDSTLGLSWHLPSCYTDSVRGFTITATPDAPSVTNVVETFSLPRNVTLEDGFSVGTLRDVGNATPLLKIAPYTSSACTLGSVVTLTSRSQLTYRYRSSYALNQKFKIQVRFDGDSWTDVSTPILPSTGSTSWKYARVFLGEHAGARAEVRVVASFNYGEYYVQDFYALLDNITFTDVLVGGTPKTYTTDGQARSFILTGLDAGVRYRFSVVPQFDDPDKPDFVSTLIAGVARLPRPGVCSSVTHTLSYDSATAGPDWSVSGTTSGKSIKTDFWDGGFLLNVPGTLTTASTLSFKWKVSGYYNSKSYDVFLATFTETSGKTTQLWKLKNTANKTSWQTQTISLAAFAGKSGELSVTFTHEGSQYTDVSPASFTSISVTNVREDVLPDLAWTEETKTTCAPPQILSVSSSDPPFREGFFREAAIGTNHFDVACSETVVSLTASSSHPSLVADDDITVYNLGFGRFIVEVIPSGLAAAADRSRLILTLAATDANGTKTYKDLVLRFSSETAPQSPPEIPSYTIHFDANGGQGEIPDLVCRFGAVQRLPTHAFTFPNAIFLGWATNALGAVIYADGTEVSNPTSIPDDTVTLHAVWGTLTATAGVYVAWSMAELGFDVPTDGRAYTVTARGLPAGLKLVKSPAVTKKVKDKKTGRTKTVVVIPAGTNWWIEGVPTTRQDLLTLPTFLTVTVDGVSTTSVLPVNIAAQAVTDLGELPLGVAVKMTNGLPGVTNGWTVTGLPTGLKYSSDTPAFTVYGTPTKAGLFTVTAKKKVNGFYETLKFRVLVTPKAVDATRFGEALTNLTTTAYEPFLQSLAGGSTPVTKVSGLPAGITFNAKMQVVSGTPTKAGTSVVTFTKYEKNGKKTIARTAQILWTVVANPATPTLAFNEAGGTVLEGNVGVVAAGLVAFAASEGAMVTASGLPTGVTLVNLGGGQWGFKGFTTKAGVYLVTVKATVKGNTVTQRLALRVTALPTWARGTFDGCEESSERREEVGASPVGVVRLSVGTTGKISGTLREHGTNWTLGAACYTGFADGAYTCTNMTAKYAYKTTRTVKGKKQNVTKTLMRTFSITVTNGETLGTRICAQMVGTEVSPLIPSPLTLPPSTFSFVAHPNEWAGAYKAIGQTLFYQSKKAPYRIYTYKTENLPDVLTEGETLTLKITPAGVVTATFAHPTGKKDKKTKKEIVYKATTSATLIPTTSAAEGATGFCGVVSLHVPASPTNDFRTRCFQLVLGQN